MKKAHGWILGILLLPVLLFLAITAALYIPPVQDWAVATAARIATEGTGLNVSVGRVGLTFPLDFDMRHVTATDAEGDTLLDIERLVVDLDMARVMRLEIGLDEVSLHNGRADTKDMVDGLAIKGRIGRLSIALPQGAGTAERDRSVVDLRQRRVNIHSLEAEGCHFDIAIGHSEPDTTAAKPSPWQVEAGRIRLEDTRLRLATDSLYADLCVEAAAAKAITCVLEKEDYGCSDVLLKAAAALWLPSVSPDTLLIDNIDISADKAQYSPQRTEVKGLVAKVMHSQLEATATVWLPQLSLDASIGCAVDRRDLLWACALAGEDTIEAARLLPQEPLTIDIQADGSPEQMRLRQAVACLPGMARIQLCGEAGNVGDMAKLTADIGFEIETLDLKGLSRSAGVNIPKMRLEGRATAAGQQYAAQARIDMAGRQVATLDGRYDLPKESYSAKLNFSHLSLQDIVPSLPLSAITAAVTAEGTGSDMMSAHTNMTLRAEVKQCVLNDMDMQDLCVVANYGHRKASLLIDCNNPQIDGNIWLGAIVRGRDSVDVNLALDLARLDLCELHLTEKPLSMAARLTLDGMSDLKSRHEMHGSMTGLSLMTADTVYHPKDITMDALLRPDSLAASIAAGDLTVAFDAGCGIDSLLLKAGNFAEAIGSQLKQYRLEQEQLRQMLPRAEVRMEMGEHNPLANIARIMGYKMEAAKLRLGADPSIGLNGGWLVRQLRVGAVTLDEMWCNIYQDSTGVKMDARVYNGPANPQISFDARAKAYILATGAGLNLTYTDDKGRKGVDIGTRVDILPDGISMHLTPLNPIVANRRFEVNDSNFLFMAPDGRVSAGIELRADDGTGMTLYSAEGDSTTLQDLTLSLHNVNVQELCSVMPYMPSLSGMLYGDVHLLQTTQTKSVAVDAGINALHYDGAPMGNLAFNATYLPMGDSCHYVDALLMREGEEIGQLTGTYTDDGAKGQIEAGMTLTHLPLSLIGGMAGSQSLLSMDGDVDGELTVTGSASSPLVDGYVATDGATIASPAYNVRLRVQDDTVSIARNRLELNGINIYANGGNPLVMDGWMDFADMSEIKLDTRITANRFELINAKRSAESVAYGKVLVDANASLRGTLSKLNLAGRLGVLGGTDVTYILQDSPLTVEDRLSDLVEFVDFNDTIARKAPEEEASPMALTMNMMVSVDQSAQVHCLLSADRSSYIDLEGGGDLMLGYTPQGDLTLTGRYTIISGEMKYALPVIPLKTFKLQSGSYVAWNGKMMNPQLNIAAVERTRASVSSESGANRSVAFDVGVDITQTLENIGLAFTIEAPDDATIQNELQAMDAAARGRVAVTMLATGMYITDKGAGGFSTANALNTFLQSEIMGIAGKALNSIDVNLGVEEGTSAAGTSTTDYSFSFAKRFWNNRISVSFGGRVSSGSDAQNTGATIIDNVALEYRLDQSATRYVRLSYDKNYESLLEGNIIEMGAGLLLRRKTTRLGELFIFRRKKNTSQ